MKMCSFLRQEEGKGKHGGYLINTRHTLFSSLHCNLWPTWTYTAYIAARIAGRLLSRSQTIFILPYNTDR